MHAQPSIGLATDISVWVVGRQIDNSATYYVEAILLYIVLLEQYSRKAGGAPNIFIIALID